MKKNIFSKIFLCFFLLSSIFFSFPKHALAYTEQALKSDNRCTSYNPGGTPTTIYDCSYGSYSCDSTAQGDCIPVGQNKTGTGGCTINPITFSLAGCLAEIANLIFAKLIQFLNFIIFRPLLWISSLLFDFSIYFTVAKFRSNFSELQVGYLGTAVFGNSGGTLIYFLWGMLRDFLNIIIFLSIIYQAVRSMFDGFEGTRRKFIGLLVFSILANFSLLFVKIAIDISNILTLQAYTLAVKPPSLESFSAFRNLGADEVNSFGEFLRNSVDLDKLLSSPKTTQVAKDAINNMQSTVIFQIGRMLVFAGLTYIMVYMGVLMFMRASFFLLAMIISPLIAADLFFNIWDKRGEESSLATLVRKTTTKVRGDFYDGLIKGPLVVFTMFLLGVLAESIFSIQQINNLTSGLTQMPDVQQAQTSSGPFVESIFIFFKFALFFALARAILNFINSVSINGESGQHLTAWTKKLSGRILGRTIGAYANTGGALGRRIIGQGFASGAVGQRLGTLFTGLQQSNSFLGRLAGNSIGRVGNNALANLRNANYDLRNSGTASRVGGLIERATGLGANIAPNIPKPPKEQGFEKINEARVNASKDEREKYIKDAQKGVSLTDAENKNVEDTTKVDFAGGKFTAAEIAKAISDAQANPAQNVVVGTGAGAKTIVAADIGKFFNKNDKTGASLAEESLSKANADIKAAKEKKVKDKQKEVEDIIKLQIANKSGPRFLNETGNKITSKLGVSGVDVVQEVADSAREDLIKGRQDKVKETLKKTYILDESSKHLNDSKEQLTEMLLSGYLSQDQNNEIQAKIDVIDSLLEKVNLPKGISDEDKITKYDIFKKDPDIRKEILKVSNESGEILSNLYKNEQLRLNIEEKKEELQASANTTNNPILKRLKKREASRLNEFLKNWKSDSKDALAISDKTSKLKEKYESHFTETKPDENKKTP